jgi:hypothetical protein
MQEGTAGVSTETARMEKTEQFLALPFVLGDNTQHADGMV